MAYKVLDKDDHPIKHEDKEIFGADSAGVIKSVNIGRRTLTMIATDESKDRDGDMILAKGWDITSYKKNPVFLWAHNYSSVPLAAAIRIVRRRVEGNPTEMTHKFPTKGLNPFADMILELFNQKIINAGSVGFIPLKWEDMPTEEGEPDPNAFVRRGRRFTKQELLEHSAVPVPSNPNAIQDALKSMDQSNNVKELVFNHIIGGNTYSFTETQKADISNEISEIKAGGLEVEEEMFQVQVPKNFNSEPVVESTKDEEYECECLDCGHELKTKKHCKDTKCPECGGKMRRKERPGPGDRELDADNIETDIINAIDVINDAYEAGYSIDGWIKTGAVLSGKDKASLEGAKELIQDVLETAESIERQDPLTHAQNDELNAEDDVVESILELEEDKKVNKFDGLSEVTTQLKTIIAGISKI